MAQRTRAATTSAAADNLAITVASPDVQLNTKKDGKGKKRTLDAATTETMAQKKVNRLALSV